MPPTALVDLSRIDLDRAILDKKEIRDILPHRYEFEQIDAVLHLDLSDNTIVGRRDLGASEFWVRGHVPGNPIFPGVLSIEASAQLGAIGYRLKLPETRDRFLALAAVNEVKFRGTIKPGDRVIYIVKLIQADRRVCRSRAQGIVAGKVVYEAEMLGLPI